MQATKQSLERVQLTDTKISLVMPEKVLKQIQYLCQQIPSVEWSGILFYSVKGSIKDPKNMELTCEDILPMNKGVHTYTEYSFDDRVIDYMMDNEVMEKGWKMAHLHSHCTFGVFFSGTDWSELEDNAPNHNFYLSLIVNNAMDFCAKVCFIAESKGAQDFDFVAKDENGHPYTYVSTAYEIKQKKLITYDCDIKSPSTAIVVDDLFKSRVTGIIKDEADKTARLAAQRTVTTGPGWTPPTHLKSLGKTVTPGGIGSNRNVPVTNFSKKQDKGFKRWGDEWKKEVKTPKVETPSFMTAQELEDLITDFAMYVMVTGNELEVFVDLEDICEHYEKYKIPHVNICETIMKKYVTCYESFFAGMEDHLDMESFISNTELLIDEYKHEAKMSDTDSVAGLLTKLAVSLELMVRDLAA